MYCKMRGSIRMAETGILQTKKSYRLTEPRILQRKKATDCLRLGFCKGKKLQTGLFWDSRKEESYRLTETGILHRKKATDWLILGF